MTDTQTTAPEAPAPTPTLPPEPETSALPPDPAAYDSPRAVRAREKGLEAPYIAGGHDPDPAKGLAEERRYLKLLLAMTAAIVASGFVIGTALALLGSAGAK
ncbi:MAG: hypothetical protein QOD78_1652 [Chloroflexota bacterium]|nr:hypothetical protein [Chloroflexota bacterium]